MRVTFVKSPVIAHSVPIGTLGEFQPGVMCCKSGSVNVELRVTRRGFAPGENIPFSAEIENSSKQKMQDAKVVLQQVNILNLSLFYTVINQKLINHLFNYLIGLIITQLSN